MVVCGGGAAVIVKSTSAYSALTHVCPPPSVSTSVSTSIARSLYSQVQGRIGHALPWELIGSCPLPVLPVKEAGEGAGEGAAEVVSLLPLHFGLLCHGAVGKKAGEEGGAAAVAAEAGVSARFMGFKTMSL